MRWRFCESVDEQYYKRQTLDAMDAFWGAFSERHRELAAQPRSQQLPSEELARWMDGYLSAIGPLAWEFGPGVDGHRQRLCISAEGKDCLRQVVDELVGRAPALEGWSFHSGRIANPLDWAEVLIHARTGGSVAGWHVETEPRGHKIALRYLAEGCRRSDEPAFLDKALLATEALLGERLLDTWIADITVHPLPRKRRFFVVGPTVSVGTAESVPVGGLAELVATRIAAIREALPKVPLSQWLEQAAAQLPPGEQQIGWVYTLKPKRSEDYPAQQDMMMGTSWVEGLFMGVRAPLFSSEAFSRVGELFCYLKFDGANGFGDSKYQDRSDVERELDEALLSHGLGCQIGGGTGERYSYIDFALTDVERAITLIREILRAGRLTKRAWLLFHDAHLGDEWLGIYPDTPAPPC